MAVTQRRTLDQIQEPGPSPARAQQRAQHRLGREQRARTTQRLLVRAHHATDPERRRQLLEEVVLVNRGVADAVASRYRNRGIPLEDLQQAAYEGLVKAVDRFDPTRRKDLLTFAVPTIRGELQRHFRDHGWTVRPPRRVQELQWQVNSTIADLTQELGHEPSDAEVKERLSIGDDDYRDAMTAFGCFAPTSLDQPVTPEGSATIGELIPDEVTTPGDLAAADARATLGPVVRALPARDRRILYLRFFEDQTQEEIGRELGVTQMQVSRLLTRIMRDLRGQLT